MDSVDSAGGVDQGVAAEAADRLRNFRRQLYRCLGPRADESFELTDALLCAEGPVRSLVGAVSGSGAPPRARALYDALNWGRVEADRLRERLAKLPVSRMFGGRIVLAVDATAWLRPESNSARRGRGADSASGLGEGGAGGGH